MPTRPATYLSAVFNGTILPKVLSARCTYSWLSNVPTATVFVPSNPFPGQQPYDAPLTLSMGAGNNVVRFRGVFRKYNYSLYPRALGLDFRGYLTRAVEYENNQYVVPDYGGLTLLDLTGSATPTDADVVKAVLTRAGVAYATIGGTGLTWASRSLATYLNYVWRAGISPSVLIGYAGVGQTALDYIQRWDAVSAVYTTDTAPVGFYRTYETVNGVYRSLIGGRPRGAADLTFTEGIDIMEGATSTREYPIANAAYVTGADFGITGANPVRNVNGTTFVGQSNNKFQPSSRSVTHQFASNFIEYALESDPGIVGMSCEKVANALLADLNRETVRVRFRTGRDDLVLPGYTILVRGPGGQPDLLGIGEPLWVDEVTAGVDESVAFYQDIAATGGGQPDQYTLPPAG